MYMLPFLYSLSFNNFCIIMYDGSCAPHTDSPPSDWLGTLTATLPRALPVLGEALVLGLD